MSVTVKRSEWGLGSCKEISLVIESSSHPFCLRITYQLIIQADSQPGKKQKKLAIIKITKILITFLDTLALNGFYIFFKVDVDDAKSLLSAVSYVSTRVNFSSYIVNGFCRKYAN